MPRFWRQVRLTVCRTPWTQKAAGEMVKLPAASHSAEREFYLRTSRILQHLFHFSYCVWGENEGVRVSAGARRGLGVRALLELDSQAVTGLPRWVPGRELRFTLSHLQPSVQPSVHPPASHSLEVCSFMESQASLCVFLLIFFLLNRSRNMS